MPCDRADDARTGQTDIFPTDSKFFLYIRTSMRAFKNSSAWIKQESSGMGALSDFWMLLCTVVLRVAAVGLPALPKLCHRPKSLGNLVQMLIVAAALG